MSQNGVRNSSEMEERWWDKKWKLLVVWGIECAVDVGCNESMTKSYINLAITRANKCILVICLGIFPRNLCLSIQIQGLYVKVCTLLPLRWKRERLLGSSQSHWSSLSLPPKSIRTHASTCTAALVFDGIIWCACIRTHASLPSPPTPEVGGETPASAGFHHRAATSLPHKLEEG